jgi:hypothetical protein
MISEIYSLSTYLKTSISKYNIRDTGKAPGVWKRECELWHLT